MSKIAVITGTSTGLGLYTSIALAEIGYKVYATMRDTNKSEALLSLAKEKNLNIHVLVLDVLHTDSIESCVEEIMKTEGRIDLWINNAGAGMAKTTEQATEAEVQWLIDVNFLGVVRCSKAVLPIMRTQMSGHIINISSVGGLVGQPFNELYCAAKFALEGYTEAQASYISSAFGIHFTLIEPGGIYSSFLESTMAKTMTDGQMTLPAYQAIMDKYMAGIKKRSSDPNTSTFQTAEEVAQVIVKVVQSHRPPLRIRTSEWAEEFTKLKTIGDPDGLKLNAMVQKRFLS
ncbi:SDR family oxidoreductase [Membranihabitans marinus]|uniref:SDR family oxidoreductase n=1 Tax=Membranihabitans marinus TaxID=1227546 RepID=UPI001F397C64|nr:SDR family oxidoreductase [Membranihabitans marinus]